MSTSIQQRHFHCPSFAVFRHLRKCTSLPFNRVELSDIERRRFHLQATNLLSNALSNYEEFALFRHRQVDRRRWKPIKNHGNLTVYRETHTFAVGRAQSIADDKMFVRTKSTTYVSPLGPRISGLSIGSDEHGKGFNLTPAQKASELELLSGWGPSATKAREHKRRAKSISSSAKANPNTRFTLLGVGIISGSLDDIMYGVAAPDRASMTIKIANLHTDVLDGDVLSSIEGPSHRSPFRFLGIKWMVKSMTGVAAKHKLASTRDLVYLEATGVTTRGDGVRIGYQIVHSVKLGSCPELYDSHGIIRAHYESIHIFIELNRKTVDVFSSSSVIPNGKLSESAILQNCANLLVHCEKSIQCSQNKKLAWRLTRKPVQSDKMDKALRCSVCNKTFGRFLRQSSECELCLAKMCSKCCIERTLERVDATSDKQHVTKVISSGIVELCTNCIATNIEISALTIAREEVMSGRFGTILDGNKHSSDSVTTISIEDMPRHQERHQRPLQNSIETSRYYEDEIKYRLDSITRQRHFESSRSPSSHEVLMNKTRHVGGRGHSAEVCTGIQQRLVPPRGSRSRHQPVHEDLIVKIDNFESGHGLPEDLPYLDDLSQYTVSKESISTTPSSSGGSFGNINLAMSLSSIDGQENSEMESIRDTFDSFGDLVNIQDDMDDVDEMLDTRDMEAVKRASQIRHEIWQQIADLRDAAENTYQLTKESTAKHMNHGGFIKPLLYPDAL
ncbi:hypothetical protein Plhal304r1_c041g0120151 [Plasmopara halstedii]